MGKFEEHIRKLYENDKAEEWKDPLGGIVSNWIEMVYCDYTGLGIPLFDTPDDILQGVGIAKALGLVSEEIDEMVVFLMTVWELRWNTDSETLEVWNKNGLVGAYRPRKEDWECDLFPPTRLMARWVMGLMRSWWYQAN